MVVVLMSSPGHSGPLEWGRRWGDVSPAETPPGAQRRAIRWSPPVTGWGRKGGVDGGDGGGGE